MLTYKCRREYSVKKDNVALKPHISVKEGTYSCRYPLVRATNGAYTLSSLLRHAIIGKGATPLIAYNHWRNNV